MVTRASVHQFYDRGNNICLVVLATLVKVDGFSTQVALNSSGQFIEGNPLAGCPVKPRTARQVAASAIAYVPTQKWRIAFTKPDITSWSAWF